MTFERLKWSIRGYFATGWVFAKQVLQIIPELSNQPFLAWNQWFYDWHFIMLSKSGYHRRICNNKIYLLPWSWKYAPLRCYILSHFFIIYCCFSVYYIVIYIRTANILIFTIIHHHLQENLPYLYNLGIILSQIDKQHVTFYHKTPCFKYWV